MRRALALLAATTAAAALTACGSNDGDAKVATGTTTSSSHSATPSASPSLTPSTSTTAATQGVPAPGGREAFVSFLQSRGVVPRYGSADAAVDLGLAVCTRFDSGGTKADVMQVLTSGQMPADAANTLIAAAVVGFCPQHGPRLVG